jgi:hypothetical protein
MGEEKTSKEMTEQGRGQAREGRAGRSKGASWGQVGKNKVEGRKGRTRKWRVRRGRKAG